MSKRKIAPEPKGFRGFSVGILLERRKRTAVFVQQSGKYKSIGVGREEGAQHICYIGNRHGLKPYMSWAGDDGVE